MRLCSTEGLVWNMHFHHLWVQTCAAHEGLLEKHALPHIYGFKHDNRTSPITVATLRVAHLKLLVQKMTIQWILIHTHNFCLCLWGFIGALQQFCALSACSCECGKDWICWDKDTDHKVSRNCIVICTPAAGLDCRKHQGGQNSISYSHYRLWCHMAVKLAPDMGILVLENPLFHSSRGYLKYEVTWNHNFLLQV